MRPLDFARGRPMALAAFAYVLITAGVFHNLLPVIGTRIYSDTGDALLNASILAWNVRHTPVSAAWWNYPSFAPLSGITAWTEHLLAAYPLTTPVILLTQNPLLAYNLLLFVCFPLNALSMCALAREISGSAAAGFVAGLAFAFAPYQSGQVAHVQMLMAFGMPLALLGLHQYVERGRVRGIAWFTVGWLIVLLSNAYMLVFFPVLVALWSLWFARGRWTRLMPIAAAAVAVTIVAAPLLWGYHVRQSAYNLARQYEEIKSFGADVRSLVRIPHQEWLWRRSLDTTSIEGSLFPGIAILTLAAIGIATRVRAGWRQRDPILFYAAAAIAMWLLALGPEPVWNGTRLLAYGPYRLLLLLPGASSIRVPARAWLLTALCLAIVTGGGAAMLVNRPRWRPLVAALALLIVAEGWFSDNTFEIPRGLPSGVIPQRALVLDLPIGATAENVPAEYLAVTHGYRVVNGYSGYAPVHYASLREALAAHNPEAFNAFRRLDDLYVIVRPLVDAPFLRWMTAEPGARLVLDMPDLKLYLLPRIGEGAPATLPIRLPRQDEIAFRLR